MFSISVSCDSAAVYQPQCASRAGRQRQLCGNVAQASPFYWSPPTALSGGSLYSLAEVQGIVIVPRPANVWWNRVSCVTVAGRLSGPGNYGTGTGRVLKRRAEYLPCSYPTVGTQDLLKSQTVRPRELWDWSWESVETSCRIPACSYPTVGTQDLLKVVSLNRHTYTLLYDSITVTVAGRLSGPGNYRTGAERVL
ncbi:hypothetical protein J6590_002456 [Homalodisca vitripennis]|nr:hypothetical protein J6590_002456 [Homalodisca vitripennis]